MDDKVNVLIVEDEGIVAMGLEDTLQSEGYHVAGITDNGRQALSIVEKEPVDLMLLDVWIKGEWDGIETARRLSSRRDIPFIFLTAFSDNETVNRAKEIAPAAYLLKPFQPQNLLITIDLALHNFAFRKTHPSRVIPMHPRESPDTREQKDAILSFNEAIFIKQNYMFNKVNLKDILFMEVKGNYTYIMTKDGKYVLRHTLNTILEKLKFPGFIRVHRSFAINMDHLDNFNDISVFVGGREIPLSRHYKEDFLRPFDFL